MKIVCPQCAFERNVPEDRLPATAVIATCPHCQHRFRVARPVAADAEQYDTPPHAEQYRQQPPTAAAPAQTQAAPSAADEDDPLPPGAVIPGRDGSLTPPAPQRQEARPVAADPAAVAPHASGTPPASAAPATPRKGDEPRKSKESLDWHSVKAPDTPDMPDEEDLEYRRAAAAAYEKHAEEGEEHFALSNPWEQPEKDGYAAAFYQTCVRVMFSAPRFFSGLHPDAPQRAPLFFFLLVCVIQILVERFWGGVFSAYFASSATNDPQLQQLLNMLAPQHSVLMSLLLGSALKTLELFVASGLYFLVFKLLAPGRANYQLVFQVMAYSCAPILLCVVPVAGSLVGFIWSMACSLVGCRYALRLTWPQTVLGVVPVYCLGIVLFLNIAGRLHQALL